MAALPWPTAIRLPATRATRNESPCPIYNRSPSLAQSPWAEIRLRWVRQPASRRVEIHEILQDLTMLLKQRVAQALTRGGSRPAVAGRCVGLPQLFVAEHEEHARCGCDALHAKCGINPLPEFMLCVELLKRFSSREVAVAELAVICPSGRRTRGVTPAFLVRSASWGSRASPARR